MITLASLHKQQFDPPGLKNLDPVASTQLIGKYESLYWNFFVATTGVAGIGVTGVFPQSSPQVAAYGLYSEILDGPANVTTKGSGSNVKSFDLNSYYFGCNSNSAQSAAPLAPVNCTVRATAYKGGKQVAQKSFDFVPSGSVSGNVSLLISLSLLSFVLDPQLRYPLPSVENTRRFMEILSRYSC